MKAKERKEINAKLWGRMRRNYEYLRLHKKNQN